MLEDRQHVPLNDPLVASLFEHLSYHLERVELPTPTGDTRRAEVDEFMLTHLVYRVSTGAIEAGFKHRDSRNYVFLILPADANEDEPASWRLHVPRRADAFMRGTFDVFPLPVE